MLQKYYKLFLFGIICTIICASSCSYPYNTPQARQARKQNKLIQAENKKSAAAATDSLSKLSKLSPIADDSLKNTAEVTKDSTPPVSKKGKIVNTQVDSSKTDSLIPTPNRNKSDRMKGKLDSLSLQPNLDSNLIVDNPIDSLIPGTDSSQENSNKVRTISFAKDSLKAPLQYNARDSMIYDLMGRRILLYGNAEIVYENYQLSAGYIEFNFNTNIATAEGVLDSNGRKIEEPHFSDGNQTFDARKIEYNFKSKKGKIYDASTEQGDGYLLSKSTKFISKEGDTTAKDDIIYAHGCTYTTCDHKHPHFGFRSSKAKIIPGKLIVVGPTYLEIMGTPTPLVLPFGFFPITDKRRSGLILSTNFDFSPAWGPGIRGIGYYLGLNEYIDLSLTGDFYARGTVRLNATSNYNQRYKSNGSFSIGYARTKTDEKGTPDYDLRQDFNIRWSHNQDPKAHPSQSFSASVNFGSSDFYRNTTTNSAQALQGNLQSNIAYNKRFLGTPFSMAFGASHSQNVQNGEMTITLPRFDLRMNQIYPLKRKTFAGKERWYEKIGLSYNMNANNTVTISDSLLFSPNGIELLTERSKYSVRHSPNLNMNFKVLKYFNLQPSIRYTEYWYFYSNEKEFDPNLIIVPDTTSDANGNIISIRQDTTFGTINEFRDYGFSAVRDLSAGVNLSTQLFATGTYNVLGLHKMRAIIRPTVGVNWRPDYSNEFWGYYDTVRTDTRYPDKFQTYQRYDVVPGGGKSALLTYNITTRVEGKVKKNARDTAGVEPYRKIIVLNNLSISGNYNMAVDTQQLSVVSLSGNTTLFKVVQATFSATYDPYTADINTNKRLNQLEWEVNKRFLRNTSTRLNLSTNLSPQTFNSLLRPNQTSASSTRLQQQQNAEFQFLQNMSINYNLSTNRRYFEGQDSTVITANELSLQGIINLSKGWNIMITRIGYDFSRKRITYPDFTFSRNLHCWEMGMSWQPEPKTWSFFLRVRPGSLGFLNIPMRKTQFDPY